MHVHVSIEANRAGVRCPRQRRLRRRGRAPGLPTETADRRLAAAAKHRAGDFQTLTRSTATFIDPRVVDAETLLEAMARQGEAVAVLREGVVLGANRVASLLGDLTLLARAAEESGSTLRRTSEGRTYEVRSTPIGEPGTVVLVGRDVSDRQEARQLLARSDEILSLASHELKGPLHVLGMVCHLMESRASRGEPLDAASIDRLRRQVARLNRLINEMLDVSRAQEGRLALDMDELDLAVLVRDTLAPLRESSQPRAGDLRADLVESARLRGDRLRLGAVVYQLVDNALRFTPAGAAVRLDLREGADEWVLTVADEGPGVPTEDQPLLFQRALRSGRRRGPQGLGLGLYLSAIVARLHGGKLEFAPGTPGAVFSLHLPRR